MTSTHFLLRALLALIAACALGDAQIVTSVVVSSSAIDTLGSGVSVATNITVDNAPTALLHCDGAIAYPPNGYALTTTFQIFRLSANTQLLSGNYTFPRYAPQGEWVPSELTCVLTGGGTLSLTPMGWSAQLLAAGTITQTASVPPAVVAASASPPLFTTFYGPIFVSLSVTALASPAASIARCAITLRHVNQSDIFFATCNASAPVAGLSFAQLSCSVVVTTSSARGAYALTGIQCTNANGLSGNLSAPPSAPLFGVSVNNTFVTDSTAPSITSATVDPSVVDTSSAQGRLTYQFAMAYEITGVASCRLAISNGMAQFEYPVTFNAPVYASPLTVRLTLPMGFPQGRFNLTALSCTDRVGNVAVLSPALLASASFTQVGLGDTTPPEIVSVSPNAPSIVTTRTQGVTFSVTIQARDNWSGVRACSLVYGSPVSPSVNVTCVAGTISSVMQSGAVQSTIPMTCAFPRNSALGQWRASLVSCTDNAGLTVALSTAADFTNAGLTQPLVTQTGQYDPVPPVITSFTWSTQVVDASVSAATVRAFMGVTDDVGVRTCSIQLVNPNGFVLPISVSTSSDGVRAVTVTWMFNIFRYAPTGRWNVTLITCSDYAGQLVTLRPPSQISTLPSATEFFFTVVGPSELLPPAITSIHASSLIINTSTAPVTVVLEVHWTDDVSGLNDGVLTFAPPSGSPDGPVSCSFTNNLQNLQNGSSICLATFPEFSSSGPWILLPVLVRDYSGREANLSYSLTITQIGRADVLAPSIESIRFLNNTLNTSANFSLLSVVVHVVDDVSGFKNCSARFQGPTFPLGIELEMVSVPGVAAPMLLSGNSTNGQFLIDIFFPPHMPTGRYNLTHFYCSDQAGRLGEVDVLHTNNSMIVANALYVMQVGANADLLPPNISSVAFSPKAGFVGEDVTITVSLDYQDDITGISSCTVDFIPSLGFELTLSSSASESEASELQQWPFRSSGIFNFSQTVRLPLFSMTLTMYSVRCMDFLGRETVISGEDLAAVGLPAPQRTFVVSTATTQAPSGTTRGSGGGGGGGGGIGFSASASASVELPMWAVGLIIGGVVVLAAAAIATGYFVNKRRVPRAVSPQPPVAAMYTNPIFNTADGPAVVIQNGSPGPVQA